MEQSLLTLTKSFIDNDPTEKLQKLITEENKKSRKYKMEMMKMMFGQLHLPFQELSSSILFITTVLLQVEIPLVSSKFLFVKIASLQMEKETLSRKSPQVNNGYSINSFLF